MNAYWWNSPRSRGRSGNVIAGLCPSRRGPAQPLERGERAESLRGPPIAHRELEREAVSPFGSVDTAWIASAWLHREPSERFSPAIEEHDREGHERVLHPEPARRVAREDEEHAVRWRLRAVHEAAGALFGGTGDLRTESSAVQKKLRGRVGARGARRDGASESEDDRGQKGEQSWNCHAGTIGDARSVGLRPTRSCTAGARSRRSREG